MFLLKNDDCEIRIKNKTTIGNLEETYPMYKDTKWFNVKKKMERFKLC